MANYFFTDYVVEGNKQDIDSFYEMMLKLKNAKRDLEPGHFGKEPLPPRQERPLGAALGDRPVQTLLREHRHQHRGATSRRS